MTSKNTGFLVVYKVYSTRTSRLTLKLNKSYTVDNFWFLNTSGTPGSNSLVEMFSFSCLFTTFLANSATWWHFSSRSKISLNLYIIHCVWPKKFRFLSISAKWYTTLIKFSCASTAFECFLSKIERCDTQAYCKNLLFHVS